MNKQRAEQIAQSPDMKNVMFNGTPIYIQHVDMDTDTARVFPLADPQKEFDVQVTSLIEKE
ncbi:H-type small acid-soluble spore protein [Salipaludibacillus keqinensis]|uniref:Small, acid-soluble spore protein H n=1 Tax=Salipaludibacillus keqinensis TaxID=2045207 RepID=A0A323T9T7_9BACI|nr:H-type small acid-soluble spore protein [Salipaludibacillus keqinensis]PYZ91816.1 H-type small acid-soluble spore protein [Salipaludibacillus keqinensis]